MFNFERDHAEIDEELEEPNESGYVREFYMRFTTRGIYPVDLQGKSHFRTIEEDLNAKITLKEIVANTILNSNNENYIKYAIDNAPIDTYHTFLKCAIYTLNDFAVQVRYQIILPLTFIVLLKHISLLIYSIWLNIGLSNRSS
jgi:enoyl-[acyl-carrier-protein] reductase (NADH)